jgi:hypothetical protein
MKGKYSSDGCSMNMVNLGGGRKRRKSLTPKQKKFNADKKLVLQKAPGSKFIRYNEPSKVKSRIMTPEEYLQRFGKEMPQHLR